MGSGAAGAGAGVGTSTGVGVGVGVGTGAGTNDSPESDIGGSSFFFVEKYTTPHNRANVKINIITTTNILLFNNIFFQKFF